MRKTTCSYCGKPNDRLPQSACRLCHAANMRRTRAKYRDLSPTEKLKRGVRSRTQYLIKTGQVTLAKVCEMCFKAGGVLEVHHPDYNHPRLVMAVHRTCHVAHHSAERGAA